ncbi:W2 domain-containing protein [Plasmodiophora brassicae]|uniref:W2 domain-containing protein n=1 Tax=Plasmodiophora brassicae TaxID=37360 RepID=A0A0G4J284_PLABS|nr:hypothetical protein PBRA_002090 [Plasmodiophora brassicae]SPQ93235.1 unnamed protein product [Plasmodiophora brassicae]
MAEINIGGDPNDRSYRYKRPRCLTKIEGRGNGIKTVIPNMVDVAKALRMTPSYPTKFFGIELGAQSKYDKTRDVAIVNGAHDVSAIEAVMEKFIETYVLCPSPACRLPEIRLKVKKDQIRVDCAACGYQGTVGDSHKLTVYIVKNPPTKSKKSSKDGAAESSKDKKKEKREKKKKDEDNGGDAGGAPASTTASSMINAPVTEEWYTDTSAAAAEARKHEEMAALGDEQLGDLDQRLESVQIAQTVAANAPAEEILRSFVQGQERSDTEVLGELRRLELSRGLTTSAKISALATALLDPSDPKALLSQIRSRSSILRQVARTRAESQALLGAIENMICHVEPTRLIPRTSLILHTLYESDIVSEEVLLDWYDGLTNVAGGLADLERQEMRESASRFIDWLKEAESDEEGDE